MKIREICIFATVKKLITIVVLCSLLIPFQGSAQEIEPEVKPWKIASLNGLSHTGLSTSLCIGYEHNRWKIFAGPRLALSEAYLPSEGPWGAAVSWQLMTSATEKKFYSFFNTDYQVTFQRSFCSGSDCEQKTNYTQEFSAGYGMGWKISPSFDLFNAVYFGFYREDFYNFREDNRFTNYGFNSLIRVGLSYTIPWTP